MERKVSRQSEVPHWGLWPQEWDSGCQPLHNTAQFVSVSEHAASTCFSNFRLRHHIESQNVSRLLIWYFFCSISNRLGQDRLFVVTWFSIGRQTEENGQDGGKKNNISFKKNTARFITTTKLQSWQSSHCTNGHYPCPPSKIFYILGELFL